MTPTIWKVLPWVALLLMGWCALQNAKQAGRLEQQLHVADSAHVAAVAFAAKAVAQAEEAVQKAQQDSVKAMQQVRRSEALRAATEASNAQASEARQAAERILADSAARLDGVLHALVGLVGDSRRDSVAAAQRFAQDSVSISTLTVALESAHVALTRQTEATQAAISRATGAEEMTRLLKKAKPSIFSRCGVSAGYGATASRGVVNAGPTLLVGCRVFP